MPVIDPPYPLPAIPNGFIPSQTPAQLLPIPVQITNWPDKIVDKSYKFPEDWQRIVKQYSIDTNSLFAMSTIEAYAKAENQEKWDKRFLALAEFWAKECSKDPSTKTGAVIVDKDKSVVSVGYNGFPIGVDDSEERLNNREVKYQMIVHCERNAMLFARRNLEGCTLYTWPFASCAVCAGMVIQTGIKRVVYPKLTDPGLIERWGKSLELTYQMFDEAGIQRVEVEMEKQ